MSRRFDSYMALLVCEQMASRHGQNTAKAFALGAREPGRAHDRASPTPKSTSGTRRYSEHRRCLSKPLCAPLRAAAAGAQTRPERQAAAFAQRLLSAPPAPVCVCPAQRARTHTPAARNTGAGRKDKVGQGGSPCAMELVASKYLPNQRAESAIRPLCTAGVRLHAKGAEVRVRAPHLLCVLSLRGCRRPPPRPGLSDEPSRSIR